MTMGNNKAEAAARHALSIHTDHATPGEPCPGCLPNVVLAIQAAYAEGRRDGIEAVADFTRVPDGAPVREIPAAEKKRLDRACRECGHLMWAHGTNNGAGCYCCDSARRAR